ncbi:MAG TPA: hypothetical protein DD738_13290 [Ruminiclostridium sp.]|nr:hypothetical protein [Ruminiclostridium sp.]
MGRKSTGETWPLGTKHPQPAAAANRRAVDAVQGQEAVGTAVAKKIRVHRLPRGFSCPSGGIIAAQAPASCQSNRLNS